MRCAPAGGYGEESVEGPGAPHAGPRGPILLGVPPVAVAESRRR